MKGFYVYRFFNASGIVVYVGRSKNFLNRMTAHKYNSEFYRVGNKLEYAKLNNMMDMVITEKILIHNYKPEYNTADKSDGQSMYDIPELEWKPFKMDFYERNKDIPKTDEIKVIKESKSRISNEVIKKLVTVYGIENIEVRENGEFDNPYIIINDRIELIQFNDRYIISTKFKRYKFRKSTFVDDEKELFESVNKVITNYREKGLKVFQVIYKNHDGTAMEIYDDVISVKETNDTFIFKLNKSGTTATYILSKNEVERIKRIWNK